MPQDVVPQGHRPATWEDVVSVLAKQHGVDPALALAVAQKESSMNPNAEGDSNLPGGSIGLFQLRPAAASDMGVDRTDPMQNVTGGIKYLKTLTERYRDKTTGHADLQKVLMAYNGGAENVDKGTISPEAQAYAADVLTNISKGLRTSPTTVAAPAPTDPTPVPSHIQPAAPPEHPHARTARLAAEIFGIKPSKTLPIAGAMIGGAEGAAYGAPLGPVGAFVGGLTGAGAGAFGGEGLQIGLEKLAQLFGMAPGETPPATERLASAAMTGMEGEAGGQALNKGLQVVGQKVLAPAAGKLALYAREAMQTFPGKVMPSEVSTSRSMNILENVAEGSILGGSRIGELKAQRQGLAESKVLETLESLGPATTTKAAGTGAQAARMEGVQKFRAEETPAWNTYRTKAADIPMKTTNLDAFIAEMQGREAGAILPNAGAEAARRVAALNEVTGDMHAMITNERYLQLSPARQEIARRGVDPMGNPEGAISTSTVTAGQFQKTVSDLGKLVRSLEASAKVDPSKYNAQLGLAKKLHSLARADLEASLVGHPEAQKAYEAATTITRLGNEKFFNDSVMKIAHEAPEKVVGAMLRPNNSTAIAHVEQAVGKEGMEPIRRAALDHLTRPNAKTGQIDWGQLLQRLDNLGPDTTNAMFPGGHAEEIKRLARLMMQLKTQPAGAVGKMAITLTQWGPILGALSGSLPPGAATVVLGPYAISRIMTNPTATKWLTTGLVMPKGSDQALRAAAQLTAFLRQEFKPMPSHAQAPQ